MSLQESDIIQGHEFDGDNLICPEENDNYLPSCKQAGKIIYERCIENGKRENECRQDASKAEIFYLQAGQSGHFVVPGATPESWLDSGQCKDCLLYTSPSPRDVEEGPMPASA